jgi:hypothetical protein
MSISILLGRCSFKAKIIDVLGKRGKNFNPFNVESGAIREEICFTSR